MWTRRHKPDEDANEDIHRFNEAIDQAIAESVATFSDQVERWRNVFLGILGHELRGPLSAILLSSEMLGGMETEVPIAKNVARIIDGGERMRALLDDLLDFNRVSFGLGLLINRVPVDLAEACENEVELIRTTWPTHQIAFTSAGNTYGSFDASRVREIVWNLVSNAAKYGYASEPIRVSVTGDTEHVRIKVRNSGPGIPTGKLEELFEPLRRAFTKNAVDGSLGLGLFIVRQVALAHAGGVEVSSADGTTEFSLSLHRSQAVQMPATQDC
ncbi:MAG: HAMP domain-containing sensor histidine kinase [Pseudoxanthomonas sp.]